jgi:beta-glucosidase
MPFIVRGIFVICLILASAAIANNTSAVPTKDAFLYKRADAPVEQRVADLLSRMTLREKLLQLSCLLPGPVADKSGSIEKSALDFCRQKLKEGIGTMGPDMPMAIAQEVEFRNTVQKFLAENTRLGIPVLFHDEGCHGLMKDEATSFPMPIGLACCWDEELIQKIYDVVAREMRGRGGHQALTPILDVARDPRWGRIEETMGEDPFLNGRLGGAMVRGFQGGATGEVDSEHVLSTLKHFVGHGTPEGGLNRSPALGGIRELREVHLAPFEYVIKNARPAAVMPSYNEVDGVPSHVNGWLLGDVLRQEFGFQGLVVSDYSGIDRLQQSQHIAADITAAGKLALEAGVQMELPAPVAYVKLEKQIAAGTIPEKLVDDAVRAVLTVKFKLGLFEKAQADAEKAAARLRRPESSALALEAAQKSIVLLKNDGGLLPLTAKKYPRIAVIGPNADIARLGGYSGTPLHAVSLLEGIRKKVGGEAEVLYAQGCKIDKNDKRNSFANWKGDDAALVPLEENQPLIDEARRTAAKADLVVLVLGDVESTCRESWAPNHLGDRSSLDLPGSQMELAKAVLAEKKPVVLYLMNGRPPVLGDLKERASAIIEGWYMGQETGTAAADILFGAISPSGKLTVSFPQSVGQLPCYYSKKAGAADYAYLFADNQPAFPFGFGLSYMTFSYGNLRTEEKTINTDGTAHISIDVTNTGSMGADEIVQLYVRQDVASVTRPVKELKGFQRVHLQPGEKKTVTFALEASALAIYDIAMRRRTEHGVYRVMVGPSSAKLFSVPLEVKEIIEGK